MVIPILLSSTKYLMTKILLSRLTKTWTGMDTAQICVNDIPLVQCSGRKRMYGEIICFSLLQDRIKG